MKSYTRITILKEISSILDIEISINQQHEIISCIRLAIEGEPEFTEKLKERFQYKSKREIQK